MPRRVYWDACTFLGLINQEPGKINHCRAVWNEAENDEVTIYTSFFTFAEVFRLRCEKESAKPLSEEEDRKIEQLLRQPWIRPVLLDEYIGIAARRAMRAHRECKKPSDAIHLVTAARLNVEEMHTFDGSDLLNLSGKVLRDDGQPLTICIPTPRPQPPPFDPDNGMEDMFRDPRDG